MLLLPFLQSFSLKHNYLGSRGCWKFTSKSPNFGIILSNSDHVTQVSRSLLESGLCSVDAKNNLWKGVNLEPKPFRYSLFHSVNIYFTSVLLGPVRATLPFIVVTCQHLKKPNAAHPRSLKHRCPSLCGPLRVTISHTVLKLFFLW